MHSRNSCKTLKCPRCNWHYKYQETLEIHMKEKHPENELNCLYCLTNQSHPRLARGETYTCGYKPYRCEVCNYSTTTKGNLSIHMTSDKHMTNIQHYDASSAAAAAAAAAAVQQQPPPPPQSQITTSSSSSLNSTSTISITAPSLAQQQANINNNSSSSSSSSNNNNNVSINNNNNNNSSSPSSVSSNSSSPAAATLALGATPISANSSSNGSNSLNNTPTQQQSIKQEVVATSAANHTPSLSALINDRSSSPSPLPQQDQQQAAGGPSVAAVAAAILLAQQQNPNALEDYMNTQEIAKDSYDDPSRKYKCHRCKVAFTRQSYLTAHNKTLFHRKGEKLAYPMEKYLDPNRPFKCDICKESFTQKSILLVHNNSVSHLNKLRQTKKQQQQDLLSQQQDATSQQQQQLHQQQDQSSQQQHPMQQQNTASNIFQSAQQPQANQQSIQIAPQQQQQAAPNPLAALMAGAAGASATDPMAALMAGSLNPMAALMAGAGSGGVTDPLAALMAGGGNPLTALMASGAMGSHPMMPFMMNTHLMAAAALAAAQQQQQQQQQKPQQPQQHQQQASQQSQQQQSQSQASSQSQAQAPAQPHDIKPVVSSGNGLGESANAAQAAAAAAAALSVQQQKRARTRISEEQLRILRQYFDINNSPTEEQLQEMSVKSELPLKVIKHWFRNTLFKERQKNKDSPYNFNNPPMLALNLEEYERTGEAKVTPISDLVGSSSSATPASANSKLDIDCQPEMQSQQQQQQQISNCLDIQRSSDSLPGAKTTIKSERVELLASDTFAQQEPTGRKQQAEGLAGGRLLMQADGAMGSLNGDHQRSNKRIRLQESYDDMDHEEEEEDEEEQAFSSFDSCNDSIATSGGQRLNHESVEATAASVVRAVVAAVATESSPNGKQIKMEPGDLSNEQQYHPEDGEQLEGGSCDDRRANRQLRRSKRNEKRKLSPIGDENNVGIGPSATWSPLQLQQQLFDQTWASVSNHLSSQNQGLSSKTSDSSSHSVQSSTNSKSKRANRTRFSDRQVKILQEFFETNAYPKDDDLELLSQQLGLSARVIVVWFQNARQKARKVYENRPTSASMSDNDDDNDSLLHYQTSHQHPSHQANQPQHQFVINQMDADGDTSLSGIHSPSGSLNQDLNQQQPAINQSFHMHHQQTGASQQENSLQQQANQLNELFRRHLDQQQRQQEIGLEQEDLEQGDEHVDQDRSDADEEEEEEDEFMSAAQMIRHQQQQQRQQQQQHQQQQQQQQSQQFAAAAAAAGLFGGDASNLLSLFANQQASSLLGGDLHQRNQMMEALSNAMRGAVQSTAGAASVGGNPLSGLLLPSSLSSQQANANNNGLTNNGVNNTDSSNASLGGNSNLSGSDQQLHLNAHLNLNQRNGAANQQQATVSQLAVGNANANNSSTHNSSSSSASQRDKRLRTQISPEQLDYLYQKYQVESNPSRKTLESIAQDVGLSKRVVQVWFQNTRARERRGQIRVSHVVAQQQQQRSQQQQQQQMQSNNANPATGKLMNGNSGAGSGVELEPAPVMSKSSIEAAGDNGGGGVASATNVAALAAMAALMRGQLLEGGAGFAPLDLSVWYPN